MPDKGALVIDVDGTLCPIKLAEERYENLVPHARVVGRLREWRDAGYRIVLYTSRNMRTFKGNLGLINKHTAPELIDWLERWDVPFDEIHFGKPWAGDDGFYVDDRAIRPDEFVTHTAEELRTLVDAGRARLRGAAQTGT
jgi:capsule biosynthesis phosphatase